MSATSSHWGAAVPAVGPAPALGVHVLASLRRLIITGQITPGTHLVEAYLSERYEVSRGPVRDALRQLEAERLVESRRRGVFVVGLALDDIEELYSLRQVIEREAVRRCVQDDTDLDWTPARDALAAMAAASEQGEVLAFATADLDFHSVFYTLSGHRRLESIWQQYRPTFADMLSVTITVDGDLGPTVRDHADLLQAVVDRRLEDSHTRLHSHIEGSRRRMLTAYALETDPTTA